MKIGIIGVKGRIGRALEKLAKIAGHEIMGADIGDEIWDVGSLDAVVCCAPEEVCFSLIPKVSAYFDLSEGSETRDVCLLTDTNDGSLYVPNCGLAPGAVNIIANQLINHIDADECTIYVGALPVDRRFDYQCTWSPEGLVGIYTGSCLELQDSKLVSVPALSNPEIISINGESFLALRTSGGTGTLPISFNGRMTNLQYRTLRYPGHLERINSLLAAPNPVLAFQAAFPVCCDDRVVIHIVARNKVYQLSYTKQINASLGLSAIQLATASGVLGAIEATVPHMKGVIKQEGIPFSLWQDAASVYFE